ncbi:MAG: HAD-IIIA family hydrolase [Candidatus Latescibacterota bacterium]|nr:MAG: HAD-IIIA family hydrolase [Candidatus Latescibacterota bacterium]
MAKRGHAVVLAGRRGSRLLDRATEASVQTRSVRTGGVRGVVALRSLLAAQRPDALFIGRDAELHDFCLATWWGRRPLLFQRRRNDEEFATGRVTRLAYGRCVTRFLHNGAVRRSPHLREDLVREVRDGVDTSVEPASIDRSAMRRSLRLPRKGKIVLHVGELGPPQETTLRALAATREADTPSTLAFIGTGAAEPRLRDLCHELGVQERVLWLGFRSNVEEYLSAADLLVLPTCGDDVPRTALEAMAHGLPVVASTASGAAVLIEDGINGLLVPADDPAALAAAVQRLVDDTPRADSFARRGFETIRRHWSLEAMLDDLECLVYAHLLRQQLPARRPALFLDRDGTLVDNVPYNGDPEQVRLVPGVGRALRWVRDAGFPMIVVSNQSGVAQGLLSEADLQRVNARMRELLQRTGSDVDAIYVCPHHPEHGPACKCRKPQPGLLWRAAEELGIDLSASLMVGDAPRDLEAGARAGTQRVGFSSEETTQIAAGELLYRSWTALVRDFLRALHSGERLDASVRDDAQQSRASAPTRSG